MKFPLANDRIIDIQNQHETDVKRTFASQEVVFSIQRAIQSIITAFETGNKVLIFGNGGSAADAQHFAAELIGRFKKERKALPVIALTTDTSIITALSNDYNYRCIFERQVQALVKPGDVLIGISTSGYSINVTRAFQFAKSLDHITCIALVGKKDENPQCDIEKFADITIKVCSNDTARIQEIHLIIEHTICELVEEYFFLKEE